MQGDFSRLTFDPRKQYRAVHMQQGRVQLDADWNEQVAIFNYALETQIRDLVGPAGGPQAGAGFQVISTSNAVAMEQQEASSQQAHTPAFDFVLSKGHYYVDGILCENERDVHYSQQLDYPDARLPPELKHHAIVYLDVWLRHVNASEDPSLREIALGGIDTTTRTKTVWQAKVLPVGNHRVLADSRNVTYEQVVILPEWHALLNRQRQRGRLQARLSSHDTHLENHLYRVEIHAIQGEAVTFKWSRENGSVVFEVQQFRQNEEGDVLLVIDREDLERDRTRLQKGDWVEIVDEETLLQGRVLPLYQVKDVPNYTQGSVTLKGALSDDLGYLGQTKHRHLLLRRWDHDASDPQAAALLKVQRNQEHWTGLENGLQVAFQQGGRYETGDYWLIPARAISQSIEWPQDSTQQDVPLSLPPRGTYHHYCPLTLLSRNQDGSWEVASDLRQLFAPLPVISTLAERPPVSITEITEETPAAENQVAFAERSRVLVELCVSDDDLASGDLVSLVPGSDLRVTRASRENARMVFGVVSAIGERDGEKRFLVTIYGRAWCNISGSVAAGDLLSVSEDVSGCAARVELTDRLFRPGSLLGKALASYNADDEDAIGRIPVLVTLQ
jgi:Family of unknown function (DUF6519)